MQDFNREGARYGGPTDVPPVTNPYGVPFTGPAQPAPRRNTAPLPDAPVFSAPPAPHAIYPYTPAQAAPAPAPTRAKRSNGGVGGLLLAGMLTVALVAGGVGGAGGAWLLSQSGASPSAAITAPPAASTNAPAPAAVNPTGVADQNASTIHDLYTRVANSVVNIQVSTGGRFGEGGEGSGIVIDKNHVLTNYHVVQGADTIRVNLIDNTSITAKLVGSAPQDDLAVLEANLPADKVQPAVLGDSDSAQVGDEVVAIGNPFGLDHTVTAGIISAVNRPWADTGKPVRNMIQTDAPINPGNSGGPLFNLQGQVIGITTAIESPVRGSVGVGFAIPINRAKSLLPQLTQGATVQRVWLGISGLALDADTATQLKAPVNKGVLVTSVVPDGPADKAGVQGVDPTTDNSKLGDIITAVDGNAVSQVQDITAYLDNKKVGDTVTLKVIRNGQTMDIKVTLQAWPEQQQSQNSPVPQAPNGQPGRPQGRVQAYLGIRGQSLDDALAKQLNVPITKGVVVTSVGDGSPAAQAGLQAAPSDSKAGDIITAVDGQAVASTADIVSALQNKKSGDTATLSVWRDGQTRDVKVTLAAAPADGGQQPFPFPFPGLPNDPNGSPNTP
ncbi:MAG TPA: trypsin-like peptidase domain-containing protein [Chloroflexia bacterium]|jgi:putative serine protease PepD|nr:trypsin-like peptidase domain-containing protein [Chloroflexia bacterium]